MAARTNTSNFGLTGVPLFIAIELALYGRGEQSHEEKMGHLKKAYGWLRAYLPVLYADKRSEELTKPCIHSFDHEGNPVTLSIAQLIAETSNEIEAMRKQYQPAFEGVKSCSDEEKRFLTAMDGVFERLAQIVTFSHIADRMSNTDEVYF